MDGYCKNDLFPLLANVSALQAVTLLRNFQSAHPLVIVSAAPRAAGASVSCAAKSLHRQPLVGWPKGALEFSLTRLILLQPGR